MRHFNTTGECNTAEHYMLPAAARMPDAQLLIERRKYFVIHAPRQTGKSTTLAALAEEITATGKHVALRFSCERGEAGTDDIGTAEYRLLDAIRGAAAAKGFPSEWMPPDPWPDSTPGSRIFDGLQQWSFKCPLPLVLFFDEIDSLAGGPLLSVLRQVRDGFSGRGRAFPTSIGVCGMRQLRDYKIASGSTAPVSSGRGSPFNNAITYRLADFTEQEVTALYAQHTAATGQKFTPEALELVYDCTKGQPWLVNALAAEVTEKMRLPLSVAITPEHVDIAREQLVARRPVHMDSLAARLAEPRVRAVIEPVIAGTFPRFGDAYDDDVSYVRDLGLIAQDSPLRIANDLYADVITRSLGSRVQDAIPVDPYSLIGPDDQLDIGLLLDAFTGFWLENGEWMADKTGYNEAGAQIVFMAFLQQMIRSDGFVDREFAIGSGRADILIRRRYGDEGKVQAAAFELKVWKTGRGDPLKAALPQFDKYLARFRLDSGTLIIFDQREHPAPVEERSGTETVISPGGRTVTLLRR